MFKNILILLVFITILFIVNCSDNPTSEEESPERLDDTVTDIDGNVYQIVEIGDQWWMGENLKVTHYRNGDSILYILNDREWATLNVGAYNFYNDSIHHRMTHGLLYNWYAVGDSRNVAPMGWHVATDSDWKQLEIHLGMSHNQANSTEWRGLNQGDKLKSNKDWGDFDEIVNPYRFKALPSGYRVTNGEYAGMGDDGPFWTATESDNNRVWTRILSKGNSGVYRSDYYIKRWGFSVRCVKD